METKSNSWRDRELIRSLVMLSQAWNLPGGMKELEQAGLNETMTDEEQLHCVSRILQIRAKAGQCPWKNYWRYKGRF